MSEVNPLLRKIQLPGRKFRLPSRGQFYTNGEISPEVEDGEVLVSSMTTIDEITLRSPEFLFNGEAIERVFRRCIPEIKEPLKLLSKDVDFLLSALRVVSYGGVYEINTRCPKCDQRQREIINPTTLEDFFKEVEAKAKEQEVPRELAFSDQKVQDKIEAIKNRRSKEMEYRIDLNGIIQNKTTEITEEDFKEYTVTLSNGQTVEIIPYRLDTAVMAYRYQNQELSKNLNLVEEFITFSLAARVKSVEGETNSEQISEWAQHLPISLKNELQDQIDKTPEWGTDFAHKIKCQKEECGHEWDISTLLNPITFFMTPSELEAINS